MRPASLAARTALGLRGRRSAPSWAWSLPPPLRLRLLLLVPLLLLLLGWTADAAAAAAAVSASVPSRASLGTFMCVAKARTNQPTNYSMLIDAFHPHA